MRKVDEIISKSKKESSVDNFTTVLSNNLNSLIEEVLDEVEFMIPNTRDNKRVVKHLKDKYTKG